MWWYLSCAWLHSRYTGGYNKEDASRRTSINSFDIASHFHSNRRWCCKPPSYVPYKGTYVLYKGTFGAPDQGQMLDVWESQTTGSALRWLAPYRFTLYSWSCSWSYSWSHSWTHVLGTKTMTSLILDHVAMDYLYLGTSTDIMGYYVKWARWCG